MPPVPETERRTGLLVPVAADVLVADFRLRHHAASVARRLPPHVTVLFPFAPANAVDGDVLAGLEAHFSTFSAFQAELAGIGLFDDHVWLTPEPRQQFADLIAATCARFPEFPPYDGEGGEPEPHLTIAAVDGRQEANEIAALARHELAARLPFRFAVSRVSLFEELGDGTWQESSRFGLG